MITLYKTATCPKCRIVMQKLQTKNIEFEINMDLDEMIAKGIKTVPTLDVDGVRYTDIRECNDWINTQEARI